MRFRAKIAACNRNTHIMRLRIPVIFATLAAALLAAILVIGNGFAASSAAFRDCAQCPEMVNVAAGEFTMGSPSSELYRGPEMQHRVKVPAFALGKYEVTFDEWEACVADGGCGGHHPDDQGWGKGKRPVVGVSWKDAKA